MVSIVPGASNRISAELHATVLKLRAIFINLQGSQLLANKIHLPWKPNCTVLNWVFKVLWHVFTYFTLYIIYLNYIYIYYIPQPYARNRWNSKAGKLTKKMKIVMAKLSNSSNLEYRIHFRMFFFYNFATIYKIYLIVTLLI